MTTTFTEHGTATLKTAIERTVQNRYGHFAADGREFIITDWRTPRPWVNIMSNPRVGLAVSQTGSGFSWIDNSQQAQITRWQQEFAQDSFGKFLYVRDAKTGELWSLSPAPTFPKFDHFECRHGIGYTTFVTEISGIRATWTLFVGSDDTIERWIVTLENRGTTQRRLELTAFLEWNMGVTPAPRREFHKLFLETAYDPQRRSVLAWNHMWDVPNPRFGHWNMSFPYVSAVACTEPVLAAHGDMTTFLGRYGNFRSPEALSQDLWKPHFGRHEDPIAAMRSGIDLRPGQTVELGYVLASAESRAATEKLVDQHCNVASMRSALAAVKQRWTDMLATHRIETPETSIDYLANDWLRYQAISGRIWGRAGYYQQSGAYGFRDQLQDSQIWLTIDPAQCRAQMNLHAAHQYADGTVYHWWHPLTEMGHPTKMTDDLLWLSFVAANYIRETDDLSVLDDMQPWLDDARPAPLIEHVWRAFQKSFSRTSPRGLPYIGAGDWNDGLSAVGLQEKGESIWLAQFLVGLLADWSVILRRAADRRAGEAVESKIQNPKSKIAAADDFDRRRIAMAKAINDIAWDGDWYWRATLDSGELLGSKSCRVGKLFLNAQTWAILNDVAPPDRAKQCLDAIRTHLACDNGALLLVPAYDKPVEEIGYITRYAPGLRENGGVYMHAATWAIAAAAKMGDAQLVDRLLTGVNPAVKDPERYLAEPYVTPGNVDGPTSPYPGRGGWTWYTGSAAWLARVISQWVLGVRPEFDGLHVSPCMPPTWNKASMTREWRGSKLAFTFERVSGARRVELSIDGKKIDGSVITPAMLGGAAHRVDVRFSG
ncbi:MAG: GH36-type glycosyl hydrolase domain-containing protein [Phycisphaerae bacterium]